MTPADPDIPRTRPMPLASPAASGAVQGLAPALVALATERLKRLVSLKQLATSLAAMRWRRAAEAPHSILSPDTMAAAAWATAFLLHWSETLREDCDRSDILDWAGELYPTHGHLQPEAVAQAEWESMFDEDDGESAEDEPQV
jgi:hypothetical protein